MVDSDEGGTVDGCAGTSCGKIRMTPIAMSAPNRVRLCAMFLTRSHSSCQSCLVDNVKMRMLQWHSLSELMADGP